MTLTDDQEEKVRFMLSALDDARKLLSDWERKFLDDQIKRFDEWGPKMTLTPKQWGVLNKMQEKIQND